MGAGSEVPLESPFSGTILTLTKFAILGPLLVTVTLALVHEPSPPLCPFDNHLAPLLTRSVVSVTVVKTAVVVTPCGGPKAEENMDVRFAYFDNKTLYQVNVLQSITSYSYCKK
jgi:hypothetical protein